MRKRKPTRKEWWRGFFGSLAGEVMFDPKLGKTTEREIDAILSRVPLRPGARILDVPSGTGRHSIALAKRGHAIVGIDYAKPYVAEARRVARKTGVGSRARFVRGDMRDVARLVPAGEFDLALSLYNSFGYSTAVPTISASCAASIVRWRRAASSSSTRCKKAACARA